MIGKYRLSGDSWFIIADPSRVGENTPCWFSVGWFAKHENVLQKTTVPSSWQTNPLLQRYEGVCWYFTRIARRLIDGSSDPARISFLRFNGVNYLARAWLNGIEVGSHEGGFTPFSFRLAPDTVDSALVVNDGDPLLAIRVDSTRRHDQLPEFSSDWFQWAGIYRDVFLDLEPASHVERCLISPALQFTSGGALVRAEIRVTIKASAGLKLSWQVLDPAGHVVIQGHELMQHPLEARQQGGAMAVRRFTVAVPGAQLWSPESPSLYTFALANPEGHGLFTSRFGLREVKAHGTQVLLNGKPIRLKGSSLHEEKFPHGREYSKSGRVEDISAMKALGFNFLRTAHYSHDEALVEAADELGMLVGEEIPVYWNVDFKNPKVLRLAARMMRELVYRDFNHPSVIWWSAGNEVPVSRRDCTQFMVTIMRLAKRLDPSRFSVFVTKAFLYDPARKHSDLLLLNSYFGWYYLSERLFGSACDVVHGTATRKPFLMSEFGANAMWGFGRKEPLDVKSSEWKQASIVSHAIKSFNARPYMCGWAIWIYRDFKSHMRLGKYEQGYNRKGLVDEFDRKKLLAAWMPNLIHQRREFHKWKVYLGMFISKLALIPAAFFDVLVDIVAPLVMHKVNKGYYQDQPGHA